MSAETPVFKTLSIETSDQVRLSGRLYYPNADPKALLICAHAMMVDMRTFEKSGFADTVSKRGYAVLLFNFIIAIGWNLQHFA